MSPRLDRLIRATELGLPNSLISSSSIGFWTGLRVDQLGSDFPVRGGSAVGNAVDFVLAGDVDEVFAASPGGSMSA